MDAEPDDSWKELEGTWDRLRWSRRRVFERAREAAESLGLRENTYTAYERAPWKSKHTKLDHQLAIRFARKFKVRWEWLLKGEGAPFPGPVERVRDAMEGAPLDEQERVARAVEALLKSA